MSSCNNGFQNGRRIVSALIVIIDHVKGGMALIQQYCGVITYEDHLMHFLLQVVQQHRKMLLNRHFYFMSNQN